MSKLTVTAIEQITPGARHFWIVTKEAGRIRKPIGEFKPEHYNFELDEKIVMVERRLQNWGAWLLKCLAAGLGYPSQSTLVTALQGSPATAAAPLPDDPEAEQVDKAVKKLELDKRAWAEVLINHYTRELDRAADEVAKAMGLPGRTYRYYLNMGRKYVEKQLKSC